MIKAFGTTLLLTGAMAMGASAAQASTVSHTPSGQAHVQADSNLTRRVCRTQNHTSRCHIVKRAAKKTIKARVTSVAPTATQIRQGATTDYTAQISWPAVAGATTVAVTVNGQLIDSFPADPTNSYELQQLWPATNFPVTVRITGAAGQQLALFSRTVTTASTGTFPRLYADNAFINTPVAASATVDPSSSTVISSAITPYASTANLMNDSTWGIPVVTAAAQSASYTVGCQYYWCNQDFAQQHIPTNAAPNTGSDGHMVVLQPNGDELDMWVGQHTSQGWSAGERWVEPANGSADNCTVVHQCGSADVAGFALGAGLVRPQEIAQGHIDHALAITTPDTRQGYIACPATNSDGTHTNPGALPIGAHVQLDPSIDVAKLDIPTWQKVIAVALQKYGAYVTDTGGSIGINAQSNTGLPYNAWAKAGVSPNSPSLADLPWNNLRLLNMTQCG